MTNEMWQLVCLVGVSIAMAVALLYLNLKTGSALVKLVSYLSMLGSFGLAGFSAIDFATKVLAK